MAFFPGDPEVRAGLISIFMGMIETEEQLDWLVDRALRIYSRWPGVAEIRALYCSRYKPKDGLEGYSEFIGQLPFRATGWARAVAASARARSQCRQSL